MKCPICGDRLYPGSDRCPGCGYRVHTAAPEFHPQAPQPKPRRGCCCVLPLVLLLLLLLPSLFFLLQGTVPSWSDHLIAVPEPEASVSAEFIPPDVLLPTASEGCFSIHNSAVTFLPELWDGSPVLVIPETVDGQAVTALAPNCFRDCAALTTIVLPEGLERIDRNAFDGCKSLRGLYLPETVAYIGTDAFAGCVSFEAICIPASVTTIAPGCFNDCAGLLYIIYEGTFSDWNELYDDFVNPFTVAICLDGNFYHGAPE